MSTTSKYRGHEIEYDKINNVWVYSDNKLPVPELHLTRECGHCGKEYTKEGHDGCLGTIPNIMNACCNHGEIEGAYVQFSENEIIRDMDAVNYFIKLGLKTIYDYKKEE